jgi:predicted esterase
VAHGDRDPLIPPSTVEPGARILQASGARVTTRVYPGLAHSVDARELDEVRAFLKSAIDKR